MPLSYKYLISIWPGGRGGGAGGGGGGANSYGYGELLMCNDSLMELYTTCKYITTNACTHMHTCGHTHTVKGGSQLILSHQIYFETTMIACIHISI